MSSRKGIDEFWCDATSRFGADSIYDLLDLAEFDFDYAAKIIKKQCCRSTVELQNGFKGGCGLKEGCLVRQLILVIKDKDQGHQDRYEKVRELLLKLSAG